MEAQKLRERAASYRLMSVLAETEHAARELRELADEFEAVASSPSRPFYRRSVEDHLKCRTLVGREADVSDRVIDAEEAQAVDLRVRRDNPLVGWVISKDDPDHPGKLVARLVTGTAAPYTLVADTLAELRAQLPPRLEHSPPQPSDPPHVVEIWFAV